MAGKKGQKGQPRLRADKVLEQIRLSRGNLSHAARQLGCARYTLQAFVNRHFELKQALQDEREAIVDAAENALAAAVLEKEGWAVCFTLKCLGKDRGYVERQEVANTNLNIDFSTLTDEQLQRIANGESVVSVVNPASGRG